MKSTDMIIKKFQKRNIKKNFSEKITHTYSMIYGHPGVFILSVGLLIGFICGFMTSKICDNDMLSILDILFSSNLQNKLGDPITGNFISSASSNFIFLFVISLLAHSLWGFCVVWIMPVFKGFGTGLVAGYLYIHYRFSGLIFFALILLLGFIVSSAAIILATKDALNLSLSLISSHYKCSIPHKFISLKVFRKHVGLIFALAMVGSGMDVLCTMLFAGLFKLSGIN